MTATQCPACFAPRVAGQSACPICRRPYPAIAQPDTSAATAATWAPADPPAPVDPTGYAPPVGSAPLPPDPRTAATRPVRPVSPTTPAPAPPPATPPPPPPGRDQDRPTRTITTVLGLAPRTLAVLAAAVVVVVVAAVLVTVVLTGGQQRHPGSTPVAGPVAGATGPGRDPARLRPASVAPPVDSAIPSVEASTTPDVAPAQTYTGPGGIVAQAPRGWHRDRSLGIRSVADYASPGTTAQFAGDFFRLGIGNPHPIDDFAAEARQAAAFLRSQYHARIVSGPRPTDFLGTTAYDTQFVYYNSQFGVTRHGVARIWHSGGNTLIIEASGLGGHWAMTLAVFQQLVSSATVD